MLPPCKIEQFLNAHEFSSRFVLCGSDVESMTVAELLDLSGAEGRSALERCWLGYLPSCGSEELRTSISSLYRTINKRNVISFSGAQEAIYCTLRTLLTKDDHAIIVTPCYESLLTVSSSMCSVTSVPLVERQGVWSLEMGRIAEAMTPKTKVIVVNFPHNPTGAMLSEEEQSELVRIARTYDAYILSDEVYLPLEQRSEGNALAMVDVYERALSVGVVSKAFGLPGLRIGWIASHDVRALDRALGYRDYLSICNSAPSEVLTCLALSVRDIILKKNRQLIAENLEAVSGFFSQFSDLVTWHPPAGGVVAFPSLHPSIAVDSFVEQLRTGQGVLLAPASLFDWSENRFRIGVGRRNISEALEGVGEFLTACRSSLR